MDSEDKAEGNGRVQTEPLEKPARFKRDPLCYCPSQPEMGQLLNCVLFDVLGVAGEDDGTTFTVHEATGQPGTQIVQLEDGSTVHIDPGALQVRKVKILSSEEFAKITGDMTAPLV